MLLSDIQCCVIIPTYNNRNTLRRVIDGVFKYASGQEVIVINDGSTDDTREILDSYGPRIRVLHNPGNRGKGYSLRTALKRR
jgi:glycosyltransferase involved in cell wall biosynthesis